MKRGKKTNSFERAGLYLC